MGLKITEVTGGVVLELDGKEIRSYPKGLFCLHRDVNNQDLFLITKGDTNGDLVYEFLFDDVDLPVAVNADALYTAIRTFFFPDVSNDNGPVAGIEGSVQYKDGTELGGDVNFVYDKDVSALTLGNRTGVPGQFSFALGQFSSSENDGTYAGGWTTLAAPPILSASIASFNHSYNTTDQTAGHGASGLASAILGGSNANIPVSSPRSVVLGGNGLKMPEDSPDTVLLKNLIVAGSIESSGEILNIAQITGLVSALEGKLSRGGDTSVDSAIYSFPRAAAFKELAIDGVAQEFIATDTQAMQTVKMDSEGMEFIGSDGNMLIQYVNTMKLLRFYTSNAGRGINIYGSSGNGANAWITFGDHFNNDPLNPYSGLREKGGTDSDALQAHGKNGFFVTVGTNVDATAAFSVNALGNIGIGTETLVTGHVMTVSGNVSLNGHQTLQELVSTPSSPTSGTQCRIYMKADKFIIQYNDGGTTRYKYLEMTGTGVTWVHTTVAP